MVQYGENAIHFKVKSIDMVKSGPIMLMHFPHVAT